MELDIFLVLSFLKYYKRPYLIKIKNGIKNRIIVNRIHHLLLNNTTISSLDELPLDNSIYKESTQLSKMTQLHLVSICSGESLTFVVSKSSSFMSNFNYELSNFLVYYFIKRLETPNSKSLLISKNTSVIMDFFQISNKISSGNEFSKTSKVIKEKSGVSLMKKDTNSEVISLFQSSSYIDFLSGLLEESISGISLILYKVEHTSLRDLITEIFVVDKSRRINQILIFMDQYELVMKDNRLVSLDQTLIIQEAANQIYKLTEGRIICNLRKISSFDILVDE